MQETPGASASNPPSTLNYEPASRRRSRKRIVLYVLISLLLVGGLYFGWRVGLPSLRHHLALRQARNAIAALADDVQQIERAGGSRTPATFAQASSHLASVMGSIQAAYPRAQGRRSASPPFMATSSQVIQTAQIADSSGKTWIVVVCGGGEQVSTLAWPLGSTDPNAVVSAFCLSWGHQIQASRISMPPSQPKPSQADVPLDCVVDGALVHAVLTFDSSGKPQTKVDGWQNADAMGSRMVWAEVGRHGYRNVDVSIPATKVVPHPDPVAAMHFLPDGRLAIAGQHQLEVLDLGNNATTIVRAAGDEQRFSIGYRFSEDGRYMIIPRLGRLQATLVSVLTGQEIPLPMLSPELLELEYIACDGRDTVVMANHWLLGQITLPDGGLKRFDLIPGNGALAIVPAEGTRPKANPSSPPQLAFNGRQLVLSHLAGTYVYSRDGDNWSAGTKVKDWNLNGSRFASLSPDGRWLASSYQVFDLQQNKTIFEMVDARGYAVEQASWSGDGSLLALAPGGMPVLCTLGQEKLAIRRPLPNRGLPGGLCTIVCLSADGSHLAVADRVGRTLSIWNTSDLLAQAQRSDPFVK